MTEEAGLGDVAKAQLASLLLRTCNAGLVLGRDLLFLWRRPPERPRTVVVHLVGNMGDITVALPALRALRDRYPDSRLVLVTSPGPSGRPGARDLLEGAPWIDEIVDYSLEELRASGGIRKMLATFRRLRPDVLVICRAACSSPSTVLRNLLFARLTGARFATGFRVAHTRLFPHAQVRHRRRFSHENEHYFRLMADLGLAEEQKRFEFAPLTSEAAARVEALRASLGPFAAVCTGGKRGDRWALQRFAEIGRRLRTRRGLSLVAVGSAGEREQCAQVLETAGAGVNLAGELSVLQSAELLRHALLLVTNDTGPSHLAAAVGTPVVVIFGSHAYPGRWYPYGEGHEVFRARLACEHCLLAKAPDDHCVSTIGVEEVWQGCERVLARRGLVPLHQAQDDVAAERADVALGG